MHTQARVVIVGGGVVGNSALYHLAMRGWSDCLLLDMDELTSGSTWHAAGNIPTFSSSRNMIRLQHYSTELYAKLSVDPEYPFSYHQTGSLRLARTADRFEEFQHITAMANALGLDYELIDNATMKARHPFLEDHDLQGVLWDPVDGDIDPSQLTQALAHASRKAGARIERFNKVTAIERTASGEWLITTANGNTIQAEYVINAGGYRGAEIAALVGQHLPMVAMEHQYLVTESIPELEQHEGLVPLVRDPDDSYYLRQEKNGLILGPYEWDAKPHWPDGKLPDNFAYQLYNDDLDRLEWYIEQACERMPILGTVGVQRVINGPIPYSPDGLPYIGPAAGLENFFHCCTFSFGVCQAGGAGKAIAEWVVDGRPEWDHWNLDPRRYGAYADQTYVVDRAVELYQHEYAIAYPHDEWPAGRPRYTTPVYERLKERGALFGARGGWERATWFPGDGDDASVKASYHHTNWFAAVGEECRHVRDHVGLLDLGGFTKFRVRGAGVREWLDSLIAGRMPSRGRVSLGYFCHPSGGVWSEMTLCETAENDFYLVSAAAAREHDHDWLVQHLPAGSEITIEDVSNDFGTLVIAGPRSRDLLQKLTNADLSNKGFPWLTAQELTVSGISLTALRVNYVGELGWELHVPTAQHAAVYDALINAGEEYNLREFGMYAMESMRLEKGYRAWKVDLDHETSPLRSGLTRFVDLNKPAFIGKEALVAEQAAGMVDVFAVLTVDASDVDALYGCPVLHQGDIVGYATSGGYGHRIEKSVALAYVRPDLAEPGTELDVMILGKSHRATVGVEPLYDPDNACPRA